MITSTMSVILKWIFLVLSVTFTKQTELQSVNETENLIESNRSKTYDSIVTDKDDVAIYEMENFNKHLQIAKDKTNAYEANLNNTLRYLAVDKHEAADLRYMYFANISIGLMQQSIYSTRDRLQETRKFRQIFADDPAYRAAMIYATLLQLRTKMDNIFSTLRNMKSDGNFVHALILYERMVVASVDVETFVNQLFEIQEFYKRLHFNRVN